MSDAKRFIIVGTGGRGGYWCRAALPPLLQAGRIRPVAAVDISAEAHGNAIEGLGLPAEKCYTDMAAAFAENEADFAICVTPPKFHEPVYDLALEHGLDILSEKPIADTMEACCRVYKKVQAAGKKMLVTMSHRADQDKQSLACRVQSGEYGPLAYVVYRLTWALPQFGDWGAAFRHTMVDPLLVEGTVHQFDVMRAITGSNAETIYANTWKPEWAEYGGDCSALLVIHMQNGVRCVYEGSKPNASGLNGWTQDYIRAECRDATLELDKRQLRRLRGGNKRENLMIEHLPLDPPKGKDTWLASLFLDWLEGGEEPICSLEDNLQCCALLFAAIQSARTGEVVNVQEFLRERLAAVE